MHAQLGGSVGDQVASDHAMAITDLLVVADDGTDMSRIDTLSNREAQVLAGAALGLLDKQIAGDLGVSTNTLRTYWARIRSKLGEKSRGALIREWILVDSERSSLEANFRDIESFAYSLSGDIRSPLRAITGFLRVLHEDLRGELIPRHQDLFERVIDGCKRMSDLVDAHLNLSLLSRNEFRAQTVDMGSLVDEVLDDISVVAYGNQVEVETGLAAIGDREMLRVLLANLMGSTLKLNDGASDASIRLGRFFIEGVPVFFLTDSDAELTPPPAEKLFDPSDGQQGGPEFSGIGLGLAICERVVKRHGGRIWVETQAELGTTYFFTLSPASRRSHLVDQPGAPTGGDVTDGFDTFVEPARVAI